MTDRRYKNRRVNKRLGRLLAQIVGGTTSVGFTVTHPDGSKVFSIRMEGEFPPDISDVITDHQPVSGSPTPAQQQLDAYARLVAEESVRVLAAQGIAATLHDYLPTYLLPPVGLALRSETWDPVRPTEEHLAQLRAIIGPDDPELVRRLLNDPGGRQYTYRLLQSMLSSLPFFAWEDNDSPFEDEHWIPVRYAGIAITLTGTLSAAQVEELQMKLRV